MARPKVKLNHSGVRAVLNDSGVRAELTRRAERVLAAAKESAPVESGEYRDNLHIEQATTDRASVRVVSDTDHSLVVEAKTGNLARALDAAGGA